MDAELALEADILHYTLWHSLVAGGVAGLVIDIGLYPLDTIKTRLQTEAGFFRSGGFQGIYKGLTPVAAGAAPINALFFCVYDACKSLLGHDTDTNTSPYIHMTSAAIAEGLACMIRVPVEIAKQRLQVINGKLPHHQNTAVQILGRAYRKDGFFRGLYCGFGPTLMRELPFSLMQFTLWEFLKNEWLPITGLTATPYSVALCGAIASGISAGITTPLDVAKTRIMLADQGRERTLTVKVILRSIYMQRGWKGIFAGFLPRVVWITVGGAFYFGFYELTLNALGEKTSLDTDSQSANN